MGKMPKRSKKNKKFVFDQRESRIKDIVNKMKKTLKDK